MAFWFTPSHDNRPDTKLVTIFAGAAAGESDAVTDDVDSAEAVSDVAAGAEVTPTCDAPSLTVIVDAASLGGNAPAVGVAVDEAEVATGDPIFEPPPAPVVRPADASES